MVLVGSYFVTLSMIGRNITRVNKSLEHTVFILSKRDGFKMLQRQGQGWKRILVGHW